MKTLMISFLIAFVLINTSAQNITWTKYSSQNSPLPGNFITSIHVDENNNKWIGCNSLVKYDGETWTVYDTSNSELPSNHVTCITEDKTGKLWIGTSHGLASFDGSNWEVFTTGNSGLPAEVITALKTDSAGIWVGAMDFATYVNGGLGYYDGNNWIIYKKENTPLPDNRIMSLNISNSVLWIGTVNGLARFQNGNWNVYQQDSTALNANDCISAIDFDSTHNIWLACTAMPQILAPVIEGGLAKFNETEWTIFTYHNSPLPQNANSINYVYVDKFENIWSALWFQDEDIYSTWGIGMSRLNHNNEWSIYENEYTSSITCITMDNSNHLWIGTYNGLTEMVDSTLTDNISNFKETRFDSYILFQNYPNPFNPVTKISWQSPVPGLQSLKVYDVLGNEVATLVNEEKPAGYSEVDFDGRSFASGIYFYVLRSGGFVQSRKMLLLK